MVCAPSLWGAERSPDEHRIERNRGQRKGLWTVREVAQNALLGASGGSILRAQAKEGQGRPVDANGRHWGSFEIVEWKV